MCGFVGVIDPAGTSLDVISQMTQTLEHRGPSDWGLLFWDAERDRFAEPRTGQNSVVSPMVMGFRRLSILDLSPNAHQPMVTPDGRYAIIFNGEIYNFSELRENLIQKGCSFRSTGDTEVLLTLYRLEGPAMLRRLNGMFAIAIYDREEKTLFLARDHLGIKPLYYYQDRDLFLYASEVKAFLFHPDFRAEMDENRLSEQLLFRYVVGPGTLLKNVMTVEPGTFAIFKNGKLHCETYWSVPAHSPQVPPKQALEEFTSLLQDSVKAQLVSDVKVGCQLSGGVDSSLVTHLAAKWHGGLFDSVSIVFDDQRYSEESYMREVNQKLGLRGHSATLDLQYISSQMATATWHNDFPLNTPNSLGIFLLAEEAKKHVTVLLSGEGADEVFGGYPRYYLASWFLRFRGLPGAGFFFRGKKKLDMAACLEEVLIGLSVYGDESLIKDVYAGFNKQAALQQRLELWKKLPDDSPIEKLLNFEQRTYLVDLLMRQDKMCMAHSIENRVPLLDYRLVEFAKRLPTSCKIGTPFLPVPRQGMRHTKPLLKRAAEKIYGPQFAYRAKSGFPLPLDELFRSKLFQEQYAGYRSALKDMGCFDVEGLDKLYQLTRDGGGKYSQTLWILMAVASWKINFLSMSGRSQDGVLELRRSGGRI